MNRWSLRRQLLAIGLVAAIGPLLVLLLVVFQFEEVETTELDSSGFNQTTETSFGAGVSPWIPAAALALAASAVVLVWFWVRRAVDPIERMTVLSDQVQAGSLDRRMALDDAPLEVRQLADGFDRMLDRLATSSALERRLIEDASHELRTPLAALAARLDVARRRADPAMLGQDLQDCELEVERLQATLDALLASARSRQSEVAQVDNDIVVLARRAVERQRILTPNASIELHAPAQAQLGIDGQAVERAIANLLSNALEHGASPVTVQVRTGDTVDVIVTDSGPGIAAERLPHIFDRYDGEQHGIGLAIVQQVADAYGTIDVESPINGSHGTRFTLSLRRV